MRKLKTVPSLPFVVVGVLGVDQNRTPAFVEAVVVDATTNERLTWSEDGYVQREPFDASEVVMIALPRMPADCFQLPLALPRMPADALKHALLLGPNELSALRKFTHHDLVSALVDWSKRVPLCSDHVLGAVLLEDDRYAVMFVTPAQSAVLLGHIGNVFANELKAVIHRGDDVDVVLWSWRVQRSARGDVALMAVAAVGFEAAKRDDLATLMQRGTSDAEWSVAYEAASRRLCQPVLQALSQNDCAIMESVRIAMSDYDAFIPHGASQHKAVHRLVARGLLRNNGWGTCEGGCDSVVHQREPTECDSYVFTAAGNLWTSP